MSRSFLIAGLLIVVVVAGVMGVRRHQTKARSTAPAVDQLAVPIQSVIESTSLTAADGHTGDGVATRQFIDQLFIHGITADLPALPTGQFYGAWLAQTGRPASAVATGKLSKHDASFSLDYSSPVDYSAYSDVLITVQTADNQPPGTVVLRGAFQAK